MRVLVLALLLLAASSPVDAADPPERLSTGAMLPRLEGDLLSGRAAALPDAARGTVTLLALGFSYDSRFAVEEWVGRFRAAYGGQPDIGFFEVPMLGTGARLARWFIDSGMRRNTPSELQEHVLTVYGGTGPWKARLGVTNDRFAYLLLLDRDGRVRWMHAGLFAEEPFGDLRSAADGLLAR